MAEGIQFGRYMLLDRLAAGGMAELFLARVTGEGGFEKLCVIKKVLPHLAGAPGFKEMFLDEARLVARLEHPAIVQIFDVGKEGDDYYLAMEYLTGEDLQTILGELKLLKRQMPFDVAAKIISVTCEAMHYAHEAVGSNREPLNVVHRDISPSNVFVTYQGGVKLLDFGIARAEHRLERTELGQVKGKQAYMSPEQSLGKPIDRRTDVWALGVCLWELLTGRRLFRRDSTDEVRRAVLLEEVPAPSLFRPDVPPALDALTMRALERDPERRLPTADALRLELDAFLSDRTYVSSTVQLSGFMKSLFSMNHISERSNRRTTLKPQQATVPLNVEPPTDRVPAPNRGRRAVTVAAWAMLAGGVVTAALAVGWGLRARNERAADPPAPEVRPTVTEAPPVPAKPVEPEVVAVAAEAPEASLDAGVALPPAAVAVVAPPAESDAAKKKTKAPGTLNVECEREADVLIDGKSAGPAPAHRKVSAGTHTVQLVSAEFGRSKLSRVTVRPGENTSFREPFALGQLNINSKPWADVFFDGLKIGMTPLGRKVAAGEHVVRLVNPSGEKTVQVLVPTDGGATVTETIP